MVAPCPHEQHGELHRPLPHTHTHARTMCPSSGLARTVAAAATTMHRASWTMTMPAAQRLLARAATLRPSAARRTSGNDCRLGLQPCPALPHTLLKALPWTPPRIPDPLHAPTACVRLQARQALPQAAENDDLGVCAALDKAVLVARAAGRRSTGVVCAHFADQPRPAAALCCCNAFVGGWGPEAGSRPVHDSHHGWDGLGRAFKP